MNKISITTKLSRKDLTNALYTLKYRQFGTLCISALGIIAICFNAYTLIFFRFFKWEIVIWGFALLLWIPVTIYFGAKKSYNSFNSRISEEMSYEFDIEGVKITGESFKSEFTWDKVYKVSESRRWIMIWQNKIVSNIISKKNFKGNDLENFKEIVSKQYNLKNKLKA